MRYLLSIAGFDPTTGAGVTRDIITFRKFGFYGLGATTSITYQNTRGFYGMSVLSSQNVRKQIDALLDSFKIKYVKVGLVGSKDTANMIVDLANEYDWFIVFDPLLSAKNGYTLNRREDIINLLRRADVITPNVPEAEQLSGKKIEEPIDIIKIGYILQDIYGGYVVIKGGHLDGSDYLFGPDFMHSTSMALIKKNVHGTGCIYSSALLAEIAAGKNMKEAVESVRKFMQDEIESSVDMGGYALTP